jgi:hypothetical protein
MNINLYENKSEHNEHIYFIIKLYENKPGHYKHRHVCITINLFNLCQHFFFPFNTYFSKCWHRLNEPIQPYIYIYTNKPGHYKHIYFNIKLYEKNQDIIVT